MHRTLLIFGFVAGLVAADAIERDPRKQPFASNSIWNTPIGSGAQYVPANLPKVPGNNKWASMPGWDEEFIILTPTAPLTPISKSKGWDATQRAIKVGPLLANVPMPADFLVPAGSGNACTAVLMPDGRTITQFQPLYRPSVGSEALALRRFPDVDIYGPGNSGAHGGSDLSAIGGSIRVGELRPGQVGMRHALKVAVYAKQVLYRGTTRAQCYRWPATTCDSYAVGWYGTEGNNTNTAMKMGALLAIPPAVDIATMGLETAPAKQLAWTLQNYGAYIDDDTYAAGFCIDVDEGSSGSFKQQFQADYGYAFKTNCNDVNNPWMRDIQRLHQALHVVDNNGPTSIGGGGTPRQPLAAPLADPAYPVPGNLAATGSAGAVRLTWSDPSSAETGFEIWRRPLNGAWISVATVAANSTGWTDGGASAGTTWQYQVRLLMATTNASRWSGMASVTPAAAGNTAPTIGAIAAVTMTTGTSRTVSFTIGDAETAAVLLVVTAGSSNTAVVPASGLVSGGSGGSRTLAITPSGSGSATITVTVRDAGGMTASRAFTVTVDAVPAIATQPQNRTVAVGQTATFTVVATGAPVPTYQWQRNGVAIPGATAASYTTPVVATGDNGAAFRVVVANRAGSVTSAAAILAITGAGWQGSYYDNPDFTGTRVQRSDPVIGFAWGSAAPVAGIAADTFSVRWRGRVTAPASGTWTFTATTDDGVRLWVGGKRIIDRWIAQGTTATSGQATLVAGQTVEVVMEYFDNIGTATATLEWEGPGHARQAVSGAAPAAGDDLPGGWTAGDLGSVLKPGSASEAAGTWTVSGSGADIWNTADGGAFARQAVSGDLRITARVTGIANTDPWAKAGVMIRETTAAGSRHAFVCLTPTNGVAFQRRLASGGVSSHTAGPASAAPYWVRLERIGNVLIGSCSVDGIRWAELRRETIAMDDAVLVGLAVSSHADGTVCTAAFGNVEIVATPTAAN